MPNQVIQPFLKWILGTSLVETEKQTVRDSIHSDWKVIQSSPVSGANLFCEPFVDQTQYFDPADPLQGSIVMVLPEVTEARVGQVVHAFTTKDMGNFTFFAPNGGTILNAPGTAGTVFTFGPDTTYSFQCVSTDGNGTWRHISNI